MKKYYVDATGKATDDIDEAVGWLEPVSELKPCPFCGAQPSLTHGDRSRMFSVSCEDGCGAEGPRRSASDEAVAAWNARCLTQESTPRSG